MADTTRIHQLTTEILADGEPNARVHQVTTEVLASGVPEAAIHQVVTEVIEGDNPEAVIHQVVVEVIEQSIDPVIREHQLVAEVIETDNPNVKAHQVVAEVIETDNPNVVMHQVVVEIVEPNEVSAEDDVQAHQVTSEVIHTGVPAIQAHQVTSEVIHTGVPAIQAHQITAEVIIRTSTIPAFYTNDFGGYPTGSPPSDWSDFFATGDFSYDVELNSGLTYPVGSNLIEFITTASDVNIATWDDVGAIADVDILCAFSKAVNATSFNLFARVAGATSSEDGYYVAVSNTAIALRKYVSGIDSLISSVAFTQSADEYWLRFRVDGESLKAKLWSKDALEPYDWTITDTDSDVTEAGAVGIGLFDTTVTAYIDYFAVTTNITDSELKSEFPPTGFTDAVEFKVTPMPVTTSTNGINWSRALGGMFVDEGKYLHGIGIYCKDHSDDIRIAVYLGGNLVDGPAGASLIADLGKTSGAGVDAWVDIILGTDVYISPDSPLWVVLKGDNAATGFKYAYTTDPGNHGNFQVANGFTDITTSLGNDPDEAFPSGIPPEEEGWYDTQIPAVRVYLSDGSVPEPPAGVKPLIFIIEG